MSEKTTEETIVSMEIKLQCAKANRNAALEENAGLMKMLKAYAAKAKERDETIAEMQKELDQVKAEAIVSKWVSVDERLPDEDKAVIVYGGCAFLHLGCWYSYLEHDGHSYRPIQWEVTHWMPLPPVPEV